jgi:hypothetical protein
MLVAVFLVHAADPLSVKEPALKYLLIYVVLLVAGSGKYSIDYLLQGRNTTHNYKGSNSKRHIIRHLPINRVLNEKRPIHKNNSNRSNRHDDIISIQKVYK